MRDLSAIAIFCEDIRQDVNGTHSLIGIFSDAINVPQFPGMMAKFAIYIRILFHERQSAGELNIFLNRPGGGRDSLVTIDKEFVENSFVESENLGNSQTTIYTQLIASPFPVESEGRHWLEMVWKDESLDIGGIKFQIPPSNPAE